MTQKHDTGGPAYPVPTPDATDGRTHDGGMTLLDHFAGLAMSSISARLTSADVIDHGDLVSRAAYHLAEAMIAEKRRREGGTC